MVSVNSSKILGICLTDAYRKDAEPQRMPGFRPRIKYGVTPCQARGRLFFRGNNGLTLKRPW